MLIKQAVTTVLFLFTIISVHSAQAADQAEKSKNRLKPGTIQEIQGIGQNLLTAKHGEAPDPEFALLRQRVEKLQQAVEDLNVNPASLDVTLSGPSNVTLPVDKKETKSSAMNLEKERAKREHVKGALNQVRAQRTKFESAAEPGTTGKRELKHKAVTKLKELEDELDNALQAPQDVQAAKLETLRERLKIRKGKSDQKQDDTPTISTIVHHRE